MNLHEIKNGNLLDYEIDFELNESMLIGEIESKTNIRSKNVDDFEIYNNAIVNCGYDSVDVIFRGWLHKLNTFEINKVNRCHYGRGTDFEQNIVEYTSNNCCIPASGKFLKNCFHHLTGKVFTEEFVTFI